ncbi:MAG: DJ-1/PfpI family protein [Alphaproteobacteria bacterium]|nr:DJ-1/PfpI family protein [Alphaproteobacteria bacterium]
MMLALGAGAALAPYLTLGAALAEPPPDHAAAAERAGLGRIEDFKLSGNEVIAMLVYPGFTALDLVGPHYMFASMIGASVHLVTTTASKAPVESDLGLAIAPTMTLDQCPKELDVLFVPGGTFGTIAVMKDQKVLDVLRGLAAKSRFVTSVCTGSLILGRAGLLKGRRATSHWVTRDILREFGATPVDARVVSDGNVTTGAGVSAGMDFGLALLAALRGENYARAIQLQAEYAPQPPFESGTPDTAPGNVTAAMTSLFKRFADAAREAARSG